MDGLLWLIVGVLLFGMICLIITYSDLDASNAANVKRIDALEKLIIALSKAG